MMNSLYCIYLGRSCHSDLDFGLFVPFVSVTIFPSCVFDDFSSMSAGGLWDSTSASLSHSDSLITLRS